MTRVDTAQGSLNPDRHSKLTPRLLALLWGALLVGLLGGYEIVERMALRNAPADVLNMLNSIRGIAVSVVIGLGVGWVLLRVAPRVFPKADSVYGLKAGESLAEATLRQNARWFIAMRWIIVVIGCLASIMGVTFLRLLPPATLPLLLSTTAGLALSNVVYWLAVHRVKRVDRFIVLQVASDLVFLTLLLHFAGGIENPYSRVYIFHIVIAAILLRPAAAYFLTGVASFLLMLMGLAEAFRWIAHYPIGLFPYSAEAGAGDYAAYYLPFALGKITACLLVFWVTAYFAIMVSEQLRMRERELRASADELLASERRLDAVVNSMGAAIFLWSKDLRLLWRNRLAREWFGSVDDDFDGRCPMAASGKGTVACVECVKEMALSDGSAHEVETPCDLDGRGIRTLRIQAIPLRVDHDRATQVLELVYDVTESKAMQAELMHQTKMATLGRMAAALVHEIGNPIASMATRLERMQVENGSAFQRESVDLLRGQIDRIYALIQNVRRFARPPASTHKCRHLSDVLRQVTDMLRMDPRAREVAIDLDLPSDLPGVNAACDQLIQVFLNLMLNAMEAMPEGGRLTVRARSENGQVRIEFRDTGSGLTEEARANLFRPFYTTKENGSGLGLFLSHKIVCEQGGAIHAEGEPGKGSRFDVTLPAKA